MTILITTANGMFGGAVCEALSDCRHEIRAMVRDANKFKLTGPTLAPLNWDMDDDDSVARALEGVDKVFLCTPMDEKISERECRIIEAAKQAGVGHLVKIYGSVKHGEDPLITQHLASIEALKASGINWTLVSPNSVLETSVLSFAQFVVEEDAFFGMSGHGKIGLVALHDVARVAAHVLTTEGHASQNYELTGPKPVDMFEVAQIFTETLGRDIQYVDMPEAEFTKMMKEITGMPDEALERSIICHLRCWRDGMADLHTDTFEKLIGEPPTALGAWANAHASVFSK